ncbi:MAG: hypothetical protein EA402_14235 [Planctomycetota bacterium]|nr:MAG: hypothetical protein EA402_14235 [Planctomycetota bacterium]
MPSYHASHNLIDRNGSGRRISADSIEENHYRNLLSTLVHTIEHIARTPKTNSDRFEDAAIIDREFIANCLDAFVAAECEDLGIAYGPNQPDGNPESLNAILHRDRQRIIQSIKAVEPYHVITFEILSEVFPHRFGVYYSGKDRKHRNIYTSHFSSPVIDQDAGDYTFFSTFSKDISRLIVSKLSPFDYSDFCVIQMVRDGWRTCGDFG